jgi:hypothetical protein
MNDVRIILLAHSNRSYAYAAFNLAMSIKHHGCNIPVHLFGQRQIFEAIPENYFDYITWIEPDFFTDHKGLNVSLSKINVVKYLPATHNIYLDVDAMALKDLTPFINDVISKDKKYITDVCGTGKKGDVIEYDCWAKHDYAWPFFNLNDDSIWRSIQSSWAYFHKDCKEDLFNLLLHYFEKSYPLEELKERWAKDQLPDELLFSGVCATIGLDPSYDSKPMFFGTKQLEGKLEDIEKNYYLLSMYGNGSFNSSKTLTKLVYQDWYDKTILNLSREYHMPWFKKDYVMRGKIVNRQ